MSESNGNGASPNGAHVTGDDSPPDAELDAILDVAARKAIKRVDAQDPLGEDKPRIMPLLLIGAQRGYDPAMWSPDPRARAPLGSPERLAWESDPHPITPDHPEVSKVFRFVDELDAIVDAELGRTGDEDL
jgi:hypothetical protein